MSTLDEEKLKECKIVFDLFDKDKDGLIPTKELGNLMRILGAAPSNIELETIIQNLESNNHKLISFEKFIVIFQKKLESQDSEEDIINEFRKLDKENNGTISENDLRNLMSNYDNPLSDEEIEEIIQEANVDSNGNIDYINFTKILLGNL
jgi:Ca2+-binding EF-hand superfamily protein